MADCLRDEPLAIESWERLQFEMRAARDLEVHDSSSEYGSMGEFERLARAHEESPMGQRERREHQRRTEHDKFIERWAAQAERLARDRTNARFGAPGVRRRSLNSAKLYNRMTRGN